MKKSLILIILLSISLVGCNSNKEISKDEILEIAKGKMGGGEITSNPIFKLNTMKTQNEWHISYKDPKSGEKLTFVFDSHSGEFLRQEVGQQDNNFDKDKQALTIDEAIKKTIQHHNSTDKPIKGNAFLITMNENEKVSHEVSIGGKCCQATQLDQTVKVEKDGDLYIVTLKEDYNINLNGKEMISYWKYKVSSKEVTLLDKDETGYTVFILK